MHVKFHMYRKIWRRIHNNVALVVFVLTTLSLLTLVLNFKDTYLISYTPWTRQNCLFLHPLLSRSTPFSSFGVITLCLLLALALVSSLYVTPYSCIMTWQANSYYAFSQKKISYYACHLLFLSIGNAHIGVCLSTIWILDYQAIKKNASHDFLKMNIFCHFLVKANVAKT